MSNMAAAVCFEEKVLLLCLEIVGYYVSAGYKAYYVFADVVNEVLVYV